MNYTAIVFRLRTLTMHLIPGKTLFRIVNSPRISWRGRVTKTSQLMSLLLIWSPSILFFFFFFSKEIVSSSPFIVFLFFCVCCVCSLSWSNFDHRQQTRFLPFLFFFFLHCVSFLRPFFCFLFVCVDKLK